MINETLGELTSHETARLLAHLRAELDSIQHEQLDEEISSAAAALSEPCAAE
jgi:hypothetical protein